MKKKIIVLFGTLILIAVISLNINFSKSQDLKAFSLSNLLSLSEAQSEGPGAGGCGFWCYSADSFCWLQNGPDQYILCLHEERWY